MCKINIENDSITNFNEVFLKLKNEYKINQVRLKSDKSIIYESLEYFFIKDYRFKVYFEIQKSSLKEVILHWVDGELYKSDWENVNEKKLNQEIDVLKSFYEKLLGSAPVKGNRDYFWKKKWGILSIISNPRDFNVVTYIRIKNELVG
ncbi:hypothetical protein G9F31_15100 [Acinetobacter sp. 187]|uniref:hypothetical protein n=1 Tax=Acinetobacter lanii TaxID=2715163 RepID=UPI00140AE1F3|nr:hypothetical protein [Acinetobacter lanii]NHC05064.1 hypothetical protein [Acinetobacter lanii]